MSEKLESHHDEWICSNHNNNHIELALSSAAEHFDGQKFAIIPDQFSSTMYLKSQGNFTRLVFAAEDLYTRVRLTDKEAPPGAELFHNEFVDFLVCSYRRYHDASDAAAARYEATFRTLFSYFKGFPGDPNHALLVFTTEPREALKLPLTQCVRQTVLPHHPTVPQSGKWTKVGPCNEFYMIGSSYGLLSCLSNLAYGPLHVRPKPLSAIMDDSNGAWVDPSLVSETFFSAVAGCRRNRYDAMVGDLNHDFVNRSMCFVCESIRMITYFLMGVSNAPRDYSRFSPLLNLLWCRTSLITWVLQYLSDLLTGDNPRLRIIYAWQGYATFEDTYGFLPYPRMSSAALPN